ncbi:hypothetical protein N7G274_005163 [Stereocaulon virgatum]|uniref:Uncharacterized protein n=1 Tax=Stereocaulon virgatum TaxID=373712 RepID=A0ABR4A844_9LECA
MLISPSQNPVLNETMKLSSTTTTSHLASAVCREILLGELMEVGATSRAILGKKYQSSSVDNFWQYVFFTDEAHIDPISTIQGHVLRPPGTRYEPQNIQQRGEKNGVKLHIAAWVNWHGKRELQFYNNENNHTVRPRRPTKPRKSKYETGKDFAQRIREWEASLPYKREYKPKGNSMTQKYYCERLLPYHIDAIS